jgi:hypothetical protein
MPPIPYTYFTRNKHANPHANGVKAIRIYFFGEFNLSSQTRTHIYYNTLYYTLDTPNLRIIE